MSWGKIDDQMHGHPKILEAELDGIGLWTLGQSHCAAYLTDGEITSKVVDALEQGDRRRNRKAAEKLVRAGMWTRTEDGFKVHNYLKYNPSKKQVLAKREKERLRKEKWRGHTGTTNGTEEMSRAESATCPDAPDPTRPFILSPAGARVMGESWSSAGLPGLPDADELIKTHDVLVALKLEPPAACQAFKSLIVFWRDSRQVLVPPTPQKMREHMPFVQQIISGELDVSAVALASKNGSAKNGTGRPYSSARYQSADVISAKIEHSRSVAAPPTAEFLALKKTIG